VLLAILTADDAAQDGVEFMVWTGAPVRDDGAASSVSQRPLLNRAVIRHLGEPVCMIIAKTRQAALDAMELIDVAYDVDDEMALSIDDLHGAACLARIGG
jgi:carbon-monoxide dehydrogenase large subunit